VKALSHYLCSCIPEEVTPVLILLAAVVLMGGLLLLGSMAKEFPDNENYGQPATVLNEMISLIAVLPLILLFYSLSLFIGGWVLSLKATDPNSNDGLPFDPILPPYPWFPKISPYRLTVFLTPLVIVTVKAILRLTGSITTSMTIECIVIFLV